MARKDSTTQNNYTADQIQVLEGLSPVRKRPGMYIGSTDVKGLNHLITEIINNGMDEAIAGYADHVKLELLADGSAVIYDNGRGIPYGIKEGYGVSALELVYTKLHAGGKFGGGGYKVSSGLHGVGAAVVNALSEYCRVMVKAPSEVVMQEYGQGGTVLAPVAPVDLKNPKSNLKNALSPAELANRWDYNTGTIVHFKPDAEIFETTDFTKKFFTSSMRGYAFLTAGIKFEVIDYRDDTHYSYYFEGGLKTYLKALNRNKTPVTKNIFYTKGESNEVEVEVAFQYTDTYSDNVLAFANHIKTPGGGTHLTGFRTALTKTINDYARKKGLLKEKDDNLSGDDLKEGLNAIISIKLESDILQFEGQTKDKLGNSHVRPAVEAVMKDSLETFFEENPKDALAIIEKNLLALKARMAAKAARDTVIRKSALEGGGVLPGKLSDCSSKDREKTELFIVEGDSAGGTARQGRDRTTQAILPLFGKILNTERARLDKVIDNDKLKNLIVAMGAGIGEQYDPTRLRYGKLIIMADADIDGAHIATLYLTFFYRHMRELIENGHVYVAMPPLFKATWGKNKQYIQDETEHSKFLETQEGKSAIIQRFKGLGEMNEEELWETTMNPETRTLRKLTIEDAEKADEVFSMLMGSEVAPRKRFIQTHSKDADVDY